MIAKYTFGAPIETTAVVGKYMSTQDPMPFFSLDKPTEKTLSFRYKMHRTDIVYGLGQAVRGINKRGWKYESYCTDDPNHTETKHALYGAHNFLLVSGDQTLFGAFFDTPSRIAFDIGYTKQDLLCITSSQPDLALYILTGATEEEVVGAFRQLVGKSYVPPRWAFGFQQSRWGYQNAQDIEAVAAGYQASGIPLDAIYLDIDYMERYKNFTVDQKKFPDFQQFTEKMKKNGIHLVPIIDAAVKIEEGYDVYEEGIKNGYFCKDENGENFEAGVWPGKTCFPDFLNSRARCWFGDKYKRLLDCGIEGFWNDMNEPAIFYSKKGLENAWKSIEQYRGQNIGIDTFFSMRDVFQQLSNNPEDYKRFYHTMDDNTVVCHDKVHNLYGYYMTKSAAQAFDALCPDKRILLFSRASYIGMHRYGGIWTGDNHSWWSHLLLNIKMMPSLNMCGFLYTGADVGGFGENVTRDLLLRWLAFAVFTPLMRNHSALGTREQECYRFENTEDFRHIIALRYRLIPYLYSEYMKAVQNDGMLFKPLSFVYRDDPMAKTVEDQLLVGDSIMVAPVYTQNAQGRYVYLPEDMLYINFQTEEQYTCTPLTKGVHYISVALNEVPLFLRKDRILPLCKSARCTDLLNLNHLELLYYTNSRAAYTLYEDDGISKRQNGKILILTVTKKNGGYTAACEDVEKTLSLGRISYA